MLERKLTVRQVSIMTGIAKSTIEDIINERSSPRLATLEKLAIGLNLKITELFESPYK